MQALLDISPKPEAIKPFLDCILITLSIYLPPTLAKNNNRGEYHRDTSIGKNF